MKTKTIVFPASKLCAGMTLSFSNPRFNYKIEDVYETRDGQIKVYGRDFTTTEWFDAEQNLNVEIEE
jgi:hypothetical protein